VQEAIADLNYKPNPSARALRSSRTHLVALSLPDFANPFYAAIAEGVQRVLEATEFRLILCSPPAKVDAEPGHLDMLVSRHIDGLIVVSERFSPNDKTIQAMIQLGRKGYSIVSLGQSVASDSLFFDCIVTDISSGMREAMLHLLRLGHRKIAYFGPPSGVAEVRLQTFRSVLLEHGVRVDDSQIFHINPTSENGFRLAERILQARTRPTAIMAVNDMVAIGAMMAFQENGVSVPEDMSIIGIDDLSFSSIIRPKLTTVFQPKDELGALAAERLLARINKQVTSFRITSLSSHLIERESTARRKLSLQQLRREVSQGFGDR
jgi:LacI family transcriptional regulator